MNLGQLRREVRRILQEPTKDLWEDDELNDYLNEAATVMTADCQPLQAVASLSSVTGQQEYLLPSDVDEVFAVGYQIGNVFVQLEPTNPRIATQDARYLGIPNKFWVRAATNVSLNRGSDGLLDVDPINPQNQNKTGKMLGLSATPSETGKQIVIQYYANHFRMTNDLDIPVIPVFAMRGLIAYAVSIAKQKEQDYAAISKVYMPIYQDFTAKLRKKNVDRGIQMRGQHRAFIPGVDRENSNAGTDVIRLPWSQ